MALQKLLTHAPEVLASEHWLPWLGVSDPPPPSPGHKTARYCFLLARLAREVCQLVAQRAAALSLEDESWVDQLVGWLRKPRWSLREGSALALLSRP